MSIQDDLRQAVGERQGSAIRFTDIDGIGQKTAQSIKQSGRIRSPSDVSDKTADELAEQAGISESRARKAIKGAGGDPDRTPRSNTGSVSAAGIKMPQGEFVTEVSDQDKAEAKVSTSLNRGIGRSQEAAAADKGKRAPVTTDYERWKKNKGELDFPGADTPTDDPQVLPKDLRQKQRPATTDPPDPPTPRRDDTRSATGALTSSFGVSPEVQESDPTRSFEDELIDPGERRAAGGRRGNVPQGFVDNLAAGRDADLAFTEAESERGGDDRQEFDLPAWTVSRGRTYLNEKVYGEDREDLDPLRERVSDVSPTSDEPLELTRDEYDTFQRVVREGGEDELNTLEGQEANLFGDADQQREAAREARQGIINNPPMFGGNG
jgi:hypothetical protein